NSQYHFQFARSRSTRGLRTMTASAHVASSPTAPRTTTSIVWPEKHNLFGVQVSATNYDELVDALARAAKENVPAVASFHAVHAIVESTRDRELLTKVNRFAAVAPDGHPVRWALNHLHRAGLKDRVYGPELMLRLCARAAKDSIPIYLF